MRFLREGKKTIERVSEKQLRHYLKLKRGGNTRFAILEDGAGSYVQVFGGGVACCLEWHDYKLLRHSRAINDPPKVPWKEPSLLGQMRLRPEEFIYMDQVIEVFVAFLDGRQFPGTLRWRDLTVELEANGMVWNLNAMQPQNDG